MTGLLVRWIAPPLTADQKAPTFTGDVDAGKDAPLGDMRKGRRPWLLPGASYSMWDSKTGGTRYTGLTDEAGAALTGDLVVIDNVGRTGPPFRLTDGVNVDGCWARPADTVGNSFPAPEPIWLPVVHGPSSAAAIASALIAPADARLLRSVPIIGINQSVLPPHVINSVAGAPASGNVYYTPLILDPVTPGTATTYAIQYNVTTAFVAGSGSGQMTCDVWPNLAGGNGPDFSQPPIKAAVTVTITATGLVAGATGIVVTATTKVWVGTLYTASTSPAPTTPLQLSCVGSVVPNVVPTASTNTPTPGRGLVLSGQTVAPVQGATPTLTASAAGTVPVAMARRTA